MILHLLKSSREVSTVALISRYDTFKMINKEDQSPVGRQPYLINLHICRIFVAYLSHISCGRLGWALCYSQLDNTMNDGVI